MVVIHTRSWLNGNGSINVTVSSSLSTLEIVNNLGWIIKFLQKLYKFQKFTLTMQLHYNTSHYFNNYFISYLAVKFNACQKQIKVISITSEMIWYQSLVIDISQFFHCRVFLDYLWLFHSLNAFHFRTLNTHNFLICERKHQVWVCIFLVRMWQIFWHQNYLGLLKKIAFAFSAPPFSVGETYCM